MSRSFRVGEHLVGKPVFVLDLLGDRSPDFLLAKLPDGVPNHPVFSGIKYTE